jgi:hypothetical protein
MLSGVLCREGPMNSLCCAGAASEAKLHRSFAARDAAQDDMVMDYSKNKKLQALLLPL